MSTSTPNLQLPYIQAAQAQKHVTHNDAIRALDAIVQLAVRERDLAAPPASPADGDRYLVAANASGAWAGKSGIIAAYQDGAWAFLAPQAGWLVWVQAESLLIVWNGAAWGPAVLQPTLNPTPLVGINATADTTNRLAVKSPATLLDNTGNGHQLKVNKASPTDTASLLFQDGYAGRAEMGLTGDDNFHVKVSPDGAAWAEAIVINSATGQVSFPHNTLASTQVNTDWAASSGVGQILNKPTLGSAAALNAGTAAGNVVALDANAKLPAVDGSQLLNIPAGTAGPQGPAGPTGPAGPAGTAGGVYIVAPAYTNPGGQGARASLITASASSGLIVTSGSGAAALFDGVTGVNNYTNAMGFSGSLAVSSATWFTFDFGLNASKIITEATWIQSGTQAHGVWQWAGSNDGVVGTATPIGATFTLGGATSQVQTTLSANGVAYRFYHLIGVSGTTSGGPWINELQFKITGTLKDGINQLYAAASVGQVFVQNPVGGPSWQNDVADPYAGLPYSGMIAHWKLNELSGSQCLDSIGSYPIDLTLPASQNYTRTGRGIQTNNGLIQTPSIPAARMVAMLYRVQREQLSAFLLNGGNGSGNGLLLEGTTQSYSYTVANGFGVVHPMVQATATGFAGSGLHEMARGGWLLVFVDFNAAYTSALGFGGRINATSSRCVEFELAWAGVWNRSLTSTEQATVYAALRKVAMSKGLYLSMYDCPRMVDAVVLFGESTMSGHAPIASLSAADQALAFRDTHIQTGIRQSTTLNYARAHPFEMGLNQMITDGGFNPTTNFGPEFGVAYQHRANQQTRRRPLYMLKAGKGSTFLAPAFLNSSSNNVAQSWSNTDTTRQSLYSYMLRMIYDFEQGCRADGIGLNLVSLMMMLGLNDSSLPPAWAASTAYVVNNLVTFSGTVYTCTTAHTSTSTFDASKFTAYSTNAPYAPDTATYQGYIQSFFNQLQTDLGLPALPKMVLWQAHNHDPGRDATSGTNVRAGQAAFVTANSANAALITTDSYTLLGDSVHWDAPGTKQAGIDGYNASGL